MANLKPSIDQFRAGGLSRLWIDGRKREITLAVVADIRAKGFKCWRTGDQVWVLNSDVAALSAASVNPG